jgi:hypothetical protein
LQWLISLNTRASLSAAVSGGLSCCLVDDDATFEATFELDVLFDRNATVAVSLHSSIAEATKLKILNCNEILNKIKSIFYSLVKRSNG